MISTLWTGIAGLSSQQTALDNESNNIANVNTVGYKASRVSFADLMYQGSIGKGAKVTSAEKQFIQGSLNITGSSYDMALNGDGFFVVANKSATGTSENYFTRAGNFRMGENGTLQDSNGNEVQGWALSAIDADADVTSTNSNLDSFTDVFTQIAGNQVVQFTNKVETYAAKMSDYSSSAVGDASELSGSGAKTQSTKISDIEALITNYSNALSDYAEDPSATTSPSTAQSTLLTFDVNNSNLDAVGDQIYVYIDGSKITQNYIDTTATTTQKAALDAALSPTVITTDAEYNMYASRIATYEGLADKISNITGLKGYTVSASAPYDASTAYADVLKGNIKIDSIIPGDAFTVGDVVEVSGTTEVDGMKTTITENVVGSGEAAVQSAMEALRDAVGGNQLDAFKTSDIFSDDLDVAQGFAAGDSISYTIGDLTGVTVSYTATTIDTEVEAIDALVTKINTDPELSLLVEAQNINGNLVIKSKEAGEEFSGVLKFTDFSATKTYTKDKNLDISGNTGAGAEFMQIVSTVDQTSSLKSLQLKLDSLGLTDSAFGEFSVDDTGLVTMTQDGIDYVIGQVAIAQFTNNIGLEAIGDNLYAKTTESGNPVYSVANDNGVSIAGETLELSKADLSESLVNLMVFQRAFEANAKSITTADDILQTLINLKK
ncbi:flagellar hook-basal body complex protein [Arcobacter sp. s6]|uniref:flagellar hook-basal body complex protein n=1 Tax=Arcobacter sp. s6 TaxID=3230363 RepID=UPI0034A02795